MDDYKTNMLKKINPTQTKSWAKLQSNYKTIKNKHMRDMFSDDPDRSSRFSIKVDDIFIDYSKNIVTEETLKLLGNLSKEVGLKEATDNMFLGEKINETEGRAVLHIALRNTSKKPILVDGKNIMPEINAELDHMEKFSEEIITGSWKGYTGKPIKNIVNIGIGGSDLGPIMVTESLKPYKKQNITPYFVSNIDASHITETLKKVNPETTLFIIASKSFTTQETMTNAQTAREWFLKVAKDPKHVEKHFVAISTNIPAAEKFGIPKENTFKFWDWVGGRYSLWSTIGLSISCSIGFENFKDLLKGAHDMDKHFHEAPFEKNAPAILAMIGVWNTNFLKAKTEAILPYDQYMHRFPAYLQQACMESNGKYIDRKGDKVDYSTSPVVWGEPGTNGQHSFYQLIHQGTEIVPCDFIASAISHNPIGGHHSILLSNFFAQTQALMQGRTEKEVREELKKDGLSEEEVKRLTPFRTFEGNKPTNSILIKKITPRTLGSLIALYEHKVFVQGVVWNIFSFDQWGVQLGKQLSSNILPMLKSNSQISSFDSSTNELINKYKEIR